MSLKKVKFSDVLNELVSQKFYRNRRALAKQIGVSSSAVAQYLSGTSKPTFEVLCQLAAALDVSLDYLVFGTTTSSIQQPDLSSPVIAAFDRRLAELTAGVYRRNDFFSRLIATLEKKVSIAIDETKGNLSLPAGFLTDDEIMSIERCSKSVDLISMNLVYDIVEENGEYSPGRFAEIVASNIKQGVHYKFLLPGSYSASRAKNVSDQYRKLLLRFGCQHAELKKNIEFRHTEDLVVSGMGFCLLDLKALEATAEPLAQRVTEHLTDGWMGYTIAPSKQSHGDSVMDEFHLANGRAYFDKLWKKTTRC